MNFESFSVLVKPVSADCNLACEYCFYSPKSALYPETKRHLMSDEILAEFISQYMSLVGQHVSFGWQGGEPLLTGLDFFQRVVTYQQQFGKPGQVVGNGFQTNATLIDDDWARLFKRYNFLIGVSLDGPADVHDFYRRDHAGRPSFERVMKSIEILKRHGVEFNILTLLNQKNVTQPERLYDFFVTHGFQYFQFIPCIEKDAITKKAANFSITPGQYGEFLCKMFDLWMGEGRPSTYMRLFDALLMAYAGEEQPCCVFRKNCGDYVVVEYNGDVYACDFFVEPDWFLGNLMETPLKEIVASTKFNEFRERKSQHVQKCLQCQWLSLCNGGCPKDRTALQDDVSRPSYFCSSYKRLFEYSNERFLRLSRQILAERRGEQFTSTISAADIKLPAKTTRTEPTTIKTKFGRNSPCPCGSGKKYKRCCMGK